MAFSRAQLQGQTPDAPCERPSRADAARSRGARPWRVRTFCRVGLTCFLILVACRITSAAEPSPPRRAPVVATRLQTIGRRNFLVVPARYETADGAAIAHVAVGAGEVRFVFAGGAAALVARSGEGTGRVEAPDAAAARGLADTLLASLAWTDDDAFAPERAFVREPMPFDWEASAADAHVVIHLEPPTTHRSYRLDLAANPVAGELGFNVGTSSFSPDPTLESLWRFAEDLRHGRPARLTAAQDPLLASNTPLLAAPEAGARCPRRCDPGTQVWSATDLVCAWSESVSIAEGPLGNFVALALFPPFSKSSLHAVSASPAPSARRAAFDGEVVIKFLPEGAEQWARRIELRDLATRKPIWTRSLDDGGRPGLHWSRDGTRILARTGFRDDKAAKPFGRLELLDARTGRTLAKRTVPDDVWPVGADETSFILIDETPRPSADAPVDRTRHPLIVTKPDARLATSDRPFPLRPLLRWREGLAALEPVERPFLVSPPGTCRVEFDAATNGLRVNGQPMRPLRRAWLEVLASAFLWSPTSVSAADRRLQWLGPCHVLLEDAPRNDPVIVNLETGRWQYLFPEGPLRVVRLRDDGRQALVQTGTSLMDRGFAVVDVPATRP